MTEAQQFYIRKSIFFARQMSFPDSLLYLRGFLESSPDTPEFHQIREIFSRLVADDRQLELIQTGQLKLNI